MPQVVVINESTAISDREIQSMLPAFEQQWNADLRLVWGIDDAQFMFHADRSQVPPSGSWWLVFLDNSDQAGALAYHDLTNEGLPISKVFVETLEADNASISVGASHELCEMAVDPWLNGAYQDPFGTFWAGEVCDPVESDRYGYEIGGVRVTDFVTPSWFAPQQAQGPIDFKAHADFAFQVLPGGYAQKFIPHRGWVQVTGRTASSRHANHPAAGARRERRARDRNAWHRSLVRFDKR